MIGNIFSRHDALQSLPLKVKQPLNPVPSLSYKLTDPSTQPSVSVPQLPDSALSPTDSVRTTFVRRKGLGQLGQLQSRH